MCSRTGVGKTRHIKVRSLWIQDAIRDKVVHLRKVKGTENEADMGTEDLDGPTHQRLLQKLPQPNPLQTALDRDNKRRKCRGGAVTGKNSGCFQHRW